MLSNRFLALDPDPYTPLDSHHDIRTWVLEPARSWSHPIKCQLRVSSIAKSEEHYYEAVSYCWDDEKNLYLIHVNDRSYYVTDSVNKFLRYRRDKDQSVTLWIDAICINQDDHEEKQKQVQLMREIYLCSNRLIVWLGSPSGDTQLAFATILYILQGDDLKLPYVDENSRRALNSLFDRPLWTRIWIVQEIILGTMFSKGSAAVLQCGNFMAPMPAFWEVVHRISNYQIENRQHFPSTEKIVALWDLRKSIEGPSGEKSVKQLLSGRSPDSAPTLLKLMAEHRQHKASDARDKVYGLLGYLRPRMTSLEASWSTMKYPQVNCTVGLLALSFKDTPIWTCWNIVVDKHSKVFHLGYLTGQSGAFKRHAVPMYFEKDWKGKEYCQAAWRGIHSWRLW
ncbi:heterokaryon incompatibility protein-domain-containing protein [Usnea florida]